MVEGRESYEFTWVGKRGAIAEAGKPTTQTLRPDLEESVDFDKSENVFITGDNLEVLKVLQESYLGKIDMIYIDPPYNTGKDFVYSDKFQMSEEELADEMDLRDEDGLQRVGLTKNEKSSARYHSDWLNMMYPRLVLARNLLKDSGVIFISIDDNEQANLKAICDEIFGEGNFVADVIWERAYSPVNLKKHFSESHDYILVYAKNIEFAINHGIPRSAEANSRYQNIDNDPRGVWKSSDLSVGPAVPSNIYEITTPSGRKVLPPSGYSWRLNKERFEEFIADNRIWFGSNGDNVPSIKRFLSEVKNTVTPMTIWKYADVGHSQSASQDLKKIFDGKAYFTYPKPVPLMKQIVQLYSEKDGLILDFFAGSATTADAVMQLNAEDGGNRKYILCTLDEQVADKSAAKEAGYETIDQISRERIRRAAKKIQEEHPATVGKQDFGFRAYKLDSSNFKEVSQTPDSFSQESLFDSVSNIKDGRTDLDLLFQIMLTWGMELSLPIAKTQIDGIAVYNVADGALIACFADEISESVLRQIAKEEPLRAVFKDESFTNSAAKINLGQIFKEEAPGTKVKVV
ncbi:site-specific DNA-methyltransferase [Streptococcus suis]|uniref:site-specific DNA-methyltransferase n=1 Tax=Streptococcus suis TaxID=1307 RepID=UPI00211749B3|nr:site-specific DNA-methyltransferase [Streptococcus suis]MCQ8272030.1 site-specific DNA-methyltransferase [Streptococcus suis]UUM50544.1 site-specific DNA-methyltransferase [Streptococcus suis]